MLLALFIGFGSGRPHAHTQSSHFGNKGVQFKFASPQTTLQLLDIACYSCSSGDNVRSGTLSVKLT
ncbi:Uncharacterised protein [Mycobacteroides abscessus subsp. abscessus]|nr:Uncharacterised protein [Mycobacteroides abscessus subsp. abscessus]